MPYYYVIKTKCEAVCIEYYACVYFAVIIRHAKYILTFFHSVESSKYLGNIIPLCKLIVTNPDIF